MKRTLLTTALGFLVLAETASAQVHPQAYYPQPYYPHPAVPMNQPMMSPGYYPGYYPQAHYGYHPMMQPMPVMTPQNVYYRGAITTRGLVPLHNYYQNLYLESLRAQESYQHSLVVLPPANSVPQGESVVIQTEPSNPPVQAKTTPVPEKHKAPGAILLDKNSATPIVLEKPRPAESVPAGKVSPSPSAGDPVFLTPSTRAAEPKISVSSSPETPSVRIKPASTSPGDGIHPPIAIPNIEPSIPPPPTTSAPMPPSLPVATASQSKSPASRASGFGLATEFRPQALQGIGPPAVVTPPTPATPSRQVRRPPAPGYLRSFYNPQ